MFQLFRRAETFVVVDFLKLKASVFYGITNGVAIYACFANNIIYQTVAIKFTSKIWNINK